MASISYSGAVLLKPPVVAASVSQTGFLYRAYVLPLDIWFLGYVSVSLQNWSLNNDDVMRVA